MKVEVTHHFCHPLEDVFALFFDPEVIKQKNADLGARNLKISQCDYDGEFGVIKVERELSATSPVPAVLKSFHQQWNHVRQAESWQKMPDGSRQCSYRVKIAGVPALLEGRMHLQAEGTDQCSNQVTLDIDCQVPLLGRKISSFLKQDTEIQMNREYHFLKQQLIA